VVAGDACFQEAAKDDLYGGHRRKAVMHGSVCESLRRVRSCRCLKARFQTMQASKLPVRYRPTSDIQGPNHDRRSKRIQEISAAEVPFKFC
jgi:hypothetical protein